MPWFFHILAGGWIAAMLLFARVSSERYHAAMQEDRLVEWATVAVFLVAGTLLTRHAVKERRPFDLLLGLFCIFVAGEEFSWGQRPVARTSGAVSRAQHPGWPTSAVRLNR